MYFINPFQDKYTSMSPDARYTSFSHFNHWRSSIKYTEITPKKKEFIKRVLRAGWGITSFESIMRIAAGKDASSRNYRIESGGRAYLMKEGHRANPHIRDLSNLFIRFCENEGAKVPHVRLTNHGWTYYGQNCILSLYNFIEGENFGGSREGLREAAARLAQLDKILAKAPIRTRLMDIKGVKRAHGSGEVKSLFNLMRSRGARDEAEQEFVSALGYLEEKSSSLSAHNPGTLPIQAIHGNVHPHNMLFSKEGELLAFLDFESLICSQRAREVAFAMHRLARAYGEGTERREDLGLDIRERAKEFLSAYNSENPLEEAELRALRFLMQDEALCRVLTVLRNHYMRRDFQKDRHFRKRLTMLQETELFDFL